MAGTFSNFDSAVSALGAQLKHSGYPVMPKRWQSMDVQDRPEARMREVAFVSFRVPVASSLAALRADIRPNLPWADRHFLEERASGEPINPGTTWKIWPWASSADRFRTEGEQYSHSYAERYWPKKVHSQVGIRYAVGDLSDVVTQLAEDPLTRQAYLPVFFPEDTGAVHKQRVPCSIGYHFLHRAEWLHVHYMLRSCDFTRHLRDDLYLTARLLLWVLDRLREKDPYWKDVSPGMMEVNISSLHTFENDWRAL